MLDAIEKIERFTCGMTDAQFAADDKTQLAVIRAFEILGEASKLVPSDMQARYPDVAWRDMARMRDKLIHAYFGVDAAVVWETIRTDVPPTKAAIARAFKAERKASPHAGA
jgi:uncharacterized protein with HEPN domain